MTDGCFWAWKYRFHRRTNSMEFDIQGVKVTKVEHQGWQYFEILSLILVALEIVKPLLH